MRVVQARYELLAPEGYGRELVTRSGASRRQQTSQCRPGWRCRDRWGCGSCAELWRERVARALDERKSGDLVLMTLPPIVASTPIAAFASRTQRTRAQHGGRRYDRAKLAVRGGLRVTSVEDAGAEGVRLIEIVVVELTATVGTPYADVERWLGGEVRPALARDVASLLKLAAATTREHDSQLRGRRLIATFGAWRRSVRPKG